MMATRQQLEQALQNPNVRKFLDLIAHTEGTEGNGYHTAFGGGRISSLKDHPRYLKSFTQQNGKKNKTSAAGRYQFIRKTWDNLARQYGLTDFGPKSQDLGAVALLAQNGSLPHILKGDWQTAVKKSGATWASLPSAPKAYSQPTRSWQSVAKFMGDPNSASYSQPEQPQTDPRLSMSAPDLLATLRKDSKRDDNEIFLELANNNGLAGQELNYLLDQGHNPADIAQQLGLNISVAQPPQDDIDLPDVGDGYDDFMANLTAQDAPKPDLPDIGNSYEDFMANLTLDDGQLQTGDTWQTQKTLSDSTLSANNEKAPQTARSSWESLS